MAHYIGSWEIWTNTLCGKIEEALEDGKIKEDDIVWCGPSGDAVVAATAADLSEEYGDYVDSGTVSEYID